MINLKNILPDNKRKTDLIITLTLLLSLIAGLYFRLKGLDKWPFAVDEYYFTQSVANIINNGLPEYDSGGYYVRGIVQQYITAFLLILGLKAELGSRLIPLAANLLAIPGLYLLAKKVSGKTVAVAAVVVFSLSVWEVEFSRFARMYSLFQAVFIWYVYFLYKNVIDGDAKALKWVWVLSFLSIFIYEGSIFLVILNFVAFFWDSNRQTLNPSMVWRNWAKIFVPIVILIVGYEFLTFDFRSFNGKLSLPPDVIKYFQRGDSEGMVRKPVLLISTLPSNLVWMLLFLIPLSFNVFTAYRILKSKTSILVKTGLLSLLILSILNLLGLIVICFLIFFIIRWLRPKDIIGITSQSAIKNEQQDTKTWFLSNWKRSFSNPFIITAAINFLFWISFAVKTTEWHKFFPTQNIGGLSSVIKTIIKESINYPYFYETFVLFRDTVPFLTVSVVLLFVFLIIWIIRNQNKNTAGIRFLLFLFLILILAVDILNLSHFDTRYFFFLYPLIIVLSVSSLELLVGSFFKRSHLNEYGMGIAVIIFLFISEDFKLNHLLNIDSKEINFRMNFSLAEKVHFYPRWDTRTPAEMINTNASPNDLVITNEQVNDFYLKKLDYVYIDYRGRLDGVSIDEGKKELWTNADLFYDDKDLINFLFKENKTKWLIINTLWGTRFLKQDNFFQTFKKYAIYANQDSSAILYKIPGNPEAGY